MSNFLLLIYRFIYKLYLLNIPIIPNLLNKLLIRLLFNCQIGTGAKLGKNVILGYGGLGVVIHHRSIIGNNVNIGTGVTIGGTSGIFDVPQIGDNTIISSGAKVIGPIKIGKNCIIGANAVVVKDIPDNCLAVGIPAKIIKKNIDIKNYK